MNRIVDNAHLLDATEIFRKLNVHKKVCVVEGGMIDKANREKGIVHQAWFPSGYVLLLPLLDDRGLDPRRIELT